MPGEKEHVATQGQNKAMQGLNPWPNKALPHGHAMPEHTWPHKALTRGRARPESTATQRPSNTWPRMAILTATL